ncbi:MAG: N(G),N(G)-dimethylarginine dimethylaminohydrolase [Desulfobacterales bacterium]|nr:N(G),N(G)-dimethylarginine dimethylaminohydrolase [Desulfobacterales bacterium]
MDGKQHNETDPFTHAIVRPPGATFSDGITSADLGRPDLALARVQHQGYVGALERCGLQVTVLDPDDRYPDATFVEDTAVMTREWAVVTRPGALPRRGETAAVGDELARRFPALFAMEPPGTLDGGDVMAAGARYFIGLSGRTNADGAAQLTRFLGDRGCSAVTIALKSLLHLKTGVSWLGGDTLLVAAELADCEAFAGFRKIVVDPAEAYAANCIRVNDHVILPGGHSHTKSALEAAGYPVIPVDVSEFRKMDGGVSCLSLRF